MERAINSVNSFYNNIKGILSSKKELKSILMAEDLAASMDSFFREIGLKEPPFSIDDFVEKTFEHNSIIFKKLRDFLEENGVSKDQMISNKEIVSEREKYKKNFDNQNIFLSRTFSYDVKEKYENHLKKPFYQLDGNIFKKYLLQTYFTKYQKKYVKQSLFGPKQIDMKRRKERVGVRCFEDIDKELVSKIDVTLLSIDEQEKLKKTFFYKTAFPHFCSYAPYSFKNSLEGNDGNIGTPSGIFLYNENQLLYTKPDQENISAIDLNKNWDVSLLALNDFDFLLVMSIYHDKKNLTINEIKNKYKSFGDLEEKNGILFFKKDEEITTGSPGKSEKPERIEDESTREKKYRNADIILFEVLKLARKVAKISFPL